MSVQRKACALLLGAASLVWPADASWAATRRPTIPDQVLTLNSAGQPTRDHKHPQSITPDLRYVLFASNATDLVPGNNNAPGTYHAYLADTQEHTVTQVDSPERGVPTTDQAFPINISPDGRYVFYDHDSSQFTVLDRWLVDRATGRATRFSGGDVTFSQDGKYLAVSRTSFPSGESFLYLYDLAGGAYTLIDSHLPVNFHGGFNSRFGPGGWLYWTSYSALKPGTGGDHKSLFRKNITTGELQVINTAADGTVGNGDVDGFNISRDDRYVAFDSLATNLAPDVSNGQWQPFLKDLQTGALTALNRPASDPKYRTRVAEMEGSTAQNDLGFTADDSLVICTPDPSFAPEGTGGYLRRPDGTLHWISTTCPIRMSPDGLRFVYMTQWLPNGGYSPYFQIAIGRVPWYGQDSIPPVVTGTPAPARNTSGWYNTPVTVNWAAVDPSPSSGSPTTPPPTSVNGEGRDLTVFSEKSCDPAGNCATGTVKVSIDRTAPTVTVNGVVDGSDYVLGAQPSPAAITCTASDALSGLAGPCTGELTGGNAAGVGTFTYTASAADLAGNRTTTTVRYRVVYGFDGFAAPLKANTTPQALNAGRTVPLKFQLTRSDGRTVTPASTPIWITPQRGGPSTAPCDERAFPASPTAADTYRLAGAQWLFNWNTDKRQAGSYWRVGVQLDDGTVHYAIVTLE